MGGGAGGKRSLACKKVSYAITASPLNQVLACVEISADCMHFSPLLRFEQAISSHGATNSGSILQSNLRL